MGTVVQVEFKSKDNNYEGAMSELTQALGRVVELETGLVQNATPELGYSIIHDYGKGTSRDYVKSMSAAHRNNVIRPLF